MTHVTNVYAPCDNEGRQVFVDRLMQLDSSNYGLWIIIGYFNMITSNIDRNRPDGNHNNMLLFNLVIHQHDLEEVPLKAKSYAWSNMQEKPMLEKLDWIFTSHDWTIHYPNTLSIPLEILGFNHISIMIQIQITHFRGSNFHV
jgi:hypothetical protein